MILCVSECWDGLNEAFYDLFAKIRTWPRCVWMRTTQAQSKTRIYFRCIWPCSMFTLYFYFLLAIWLTLRQHLSNTLPSIFGFALSADATSDHEHTQGTYTTTIHRLAPLRRGDSINSISPQPQPQPHHAKSILHSSFCCSNWGEIGPTIITSIASNEMSHCPLHIVEISIDEVHSSRFKRFLWVACTRVERKKLRSAQPTDCGFDSFVHWTRLAGLRPASEYAAVT